MRPRRWRLSRETCRLSRDHVDGVEAAWHRADAIDATTPSRRRGHECGRGGRGDGPRRRSRKKTPRALLRILVGRELGLVNSIFREVGQVHAVIRSRREAELFELRRDARTELVVGVVTKRDEGDARPLVGLRVVLGVAVEQLPAAGAGQDLRW